MNYSVTCLSDDAPTLTGTSTKEFFVFTQADGVRAGTDYTCHVIMTVSAYNGTHLGGGPLGSLWTRTTPKSEKASITTVEGKGWFSVVYSTESLAEVQSLIDSCRLVSRSN